MVQFAIICINFALQKIQKALGKPQFKVKEIPEASLCEKWRFFHVVMLARFFPRNSASQKKKLKWGCPKVVAFLISVCEIIVCVSVVRQGSY